MWKLNKRSEQRAFEQTLRTHHSMRVRVYVLNMDHEHLADLSDVLLDGQVNIDADADVTRNATLSFLDKGRRFDFDSDGPSPESLFANRMVRIEYRVKVDAISDWVSVPIFTGPVTKLDRAGDVVNVECQGKEVLAMGAAWEPMDVKKGVAKVDAIRRIMRERGGEDRFDFPDVKERLPKTVSLGRASVPWQVCQRIADSFDDGGRQLFYDGSGRLVLRRFPGNTCYTFNDGNGGEVMSEPQLGFAVDNVANLIWVKGGKPKATRRDNETRAEFETRQDKMRGVRASAVAKHSDNLSPFYPHGLGRQNAPRYLLEEIDNDHVRSEKAAQKLADRKLKHRLQEAQDVTFDSLVIPHLEECDQIEVQTVNFGMRKVRLRQASIPLKHDGLMSVGYRRNVSMSHRRPHKRHTHKNRPHHKHAKGGRK